MSCITCSVVGMSCVRRLYSIFVRWMEEKALCVSLRGTELKRCAPSEADEERASPERNMWMPGRQRNTVVCLCVLVRRHVSNSMSASALCVFTANCWVSQKCATELDVSRISLSYSVYLSHNFKWPAKRWCVLYEWKSTPVSSFITWASHCDPV